jgi:ERCC4-related helicase
MNQAVLGIRPTEFIGQSDSNTHSSSNRIKGMSQRDQTVAIDKFNSGQYNVLVATCIAEGSMYHRP